MVFAISAILLHITGLFQVFFAYIGTTAFALGIIAYIFIKLYDDTRIVPKLVIYGLYFISATMFLGFFSNLGIYPKLIYILFTTVLSYLFLISINVFFVSEKKGEKIPLIEAAHVIVSISIVIIVFLGSTNIYKLPIFLDLPLVNLVSKTVLFAVFYFVLLKNFKWFFLMNRAGEITDELIAKVQGLISIEMIFLTEISLVLCFFPFEDFGRGAFIAVTTYIANNFIQNHLNHKLNNKFLLESITVFIVIYLFIYLL